jgi:hypothetical protein
MNAVQHFHYAGVTGVPGSANVFHYCPHCCVLVCVGFYYGLTHLSSIKLLQKLRQFFCVHQFDQVTILRVLASVSSSSEGLLRTMNGFVTVSSRLGEGTFFVVTLLAAK